jgi:threonine dehydrogenase-like Zn-dependent dehydrogenase
MYLNSVNLRIARDNVRANIPPALDLAQSGRVDPGRVISHVLHWETPPDELPKLHTKPVLVCDPVARPGSATV